MIQVNLEKITKWGIYLVAFMPLVIFSEFISPFHFGKVLVFRSLIEVLAVFYIVLLVQKGKAYLPPKTSLFWAITLFTLAFGLTTLTSINFYQSFFGTLERMGGWFSFLHFWGFFAIATAVLRSKEDWLTFIKISLAASLLSAFYGFLQKTDAKWVIGSGGRNKIFGTIGNPALFAGYMIVNSFLGLMLYFKPNNFQTEKYFYGTVFVLDAFAVLLAGVRGSVLGVVVGLIVFGLLYSFSFSSQKFKKLTLSFLILVIAAAGILYSLRNAEFVKESHYLSRYADLSLKSFTVQTRFWAWRAGFDGWNDSLKTMVVGWGPEMFNVPFSKHFNPKFFRGLGSETLFDRAHNQFLEVLFTMGLVGFIFYLLIFIRAFGILKKMNDTNENKIFRIGLISTLIAYAIHNFFIFDTSANYLMFFIALGFINSLGLLHVNGLAGLNSSIRQRVNNQIKGKNTLAYTVGLIVAAIAVFSIYKFEVVPAKANYATTRGIVASWAGEEDLAFEKFQEAMNFETFGKYEIRHRYSQYILEKAVSHGVDQKNANRLMVAIENVKKNIEESPQDYLPYLYVSRLYIMLGRTDVSSPYNDLALENSLKAYKISPTFIRTHYEIAQAYLNKKDHPNAVKWFERAVELNPEVDISKWYLGVTLVESGRILEGLKVIEGSGYGYKNSETDILRLINVYIELNDFKKLAEMFESLTVLKPQNAQYFASLAAAYKETGEKDKAIKAAQAAGQIDPSFAAEAQQFIDSLR